MKIPQNVLLVRGKEDNHLAQEESIIIVCDDRIGNIGSKWV
jgi:hypothetical protein